MITRENKLFRLSWLKSNLFRATSTETAYNAGMLENETGQDMFDRYAMTIDERPFFDEHIAQALLALLHSFPTHCTGLPADNDRGRRMRPYVRSPRKPRRR